MLTARKLILALAVAGLCACAHHPSVRSTHIIDAMGPKIVEDCDFLGGVYGESVWSHMSLGLEEAKASARDQAAFLGATHIVWTDLKPGWRPLATGRAYKCVHDHHYNNTETVTTYSESK